MTRLTLLAAVVLAASACGTDSPPEPVGLPSTTVEPATAADLAELRAEFLAELRRVDGEVVKSNTDRADLRRRVDAYIDRASRNEIHMRTATATDKSAITGDRGARSTRCGGDLPPCWVMDRESGGDLRIWNGGCYAPVGWNGSRSPCGGSTASGKWQVLRSTWARYGGFLNAADAPEDVQDAKARLLWNGGRGCAHWSACR